MYIKDILFNIQNYIYNIKYIDTIKDILNNIYYWKRLLHYQTHINKYMKNTPGKVFVLIGNKYGTNNAYICTYLQWKLGVIYLGKYVALEETEDSAVSTILHEIGHFVKILGRGKSVDEYVQDIYEERLNNACSRIEKFIAKEHIESIYNSIRKEDEIDADNYILKRDGNPQAFIEGFFSNSNKKILIEDFDLAKYGSGKYYPSVIDRAVILDIDFYKIFCTIEDVYSFDESVYG